MRVPSLFRQVLLISRNSPFCSASFLKACAKDGGDPLFEIIHFDGFNAVLISTKLFHPAHPFQPYIEYGEIDGTGLRKSNGFLFLGKDEDLLTFASENPMNQDSCVSFVIQNQNTRHGWGDLQVKDSRHSRLVGHSLGELT